MSFNIEQFWNESLAVQIHVVAALIALVLGVVMFSRRKGGKAHKNLGKFWVVMMVVVALSSFFINLLRVWGPFSPIHLLSVFTLGSLVWAVYMIRKGNIQAHEMTMKGLFVGGLLVAGGLTFSRDLLMNRIFLSPHLSGTAADQQHHSIPDLTTFPGGPAGAAFAGFAFAFVVVMVWNFGSERLKRQP